MKKYRYSQDLVDADEIRDGIIHTRDGRYLTVIEVEPVNFHLRSEWEKTNIIYNFAAWLKVASRLSVHLQLKVISCPANIDRLVSAIREEIKKEPNEKCRELQRDNLDLICSVGYSQSVSRRFFIVTEYSCPSPSPMYRDIVSSLRECALITRNFLGKCGNKIVEHKDEDLFLMDLLYFLYNRSGKETLPERVQHVLADYAKSGETRGMEPSLADTLAPRFLHVEPSCLVSNSTYYTFLYIPSGHYRIDVAGGWLAGLVNAGDGFDVDIYLSMQEKTKVRNKLGQSLRISRAKMKDAQDTNSDYDDLGSQIQSGYFIKDGLAGNEDFYYMSILITLSAPTPEILDAKVKWTRELLASQDMEAKICRYHMIDAFRSSMPYCRISPVLYERSKRNVLTYGAASTYPFTAYELTDSSGILLGINQQNNSLCIMDPFDSSRYKNANGCILGTTGSGKTFLLQLMALRFRMKRIQTFLIAPLKGFEFRRACAAVGGEFIKLSPGSPNSINILEIRPLDKSSERILDEEAGQTDDSILSKKIQKVHTFFSLIIPDISYMEDQLLDNALIEAYREKGITHDNGSLPDRTKPFQNGLPQYKEMPILGDVYDALKKQGPNAGRIATILYRYVHGSASSFNAQTNVSLDNRYIVIDLSEFDEELQPVGMFVALDYIYDKIKEDRTKRKAVFIDETWKLIGAGSNRLAADYVLEMFKIIRGYGGSAFAATQDINDFFALDNGKYGKGILGNSKLKIVLQLEQKEAERAQEILGLSDEETHDITNFERGNGLVIVNSNNIPVKMIASEMEEELITTDRKRLEQIVAERKRRQNLRGKER